MKSFVILSKVFDRALPVYGDVGPIVDPLSNLDLGVVSVVPGMQCFSYCRLGFQ